MSCESLWHLRHRTFRHDVGRILIGGGVARAHNRGIDASDGSCRGSAGDVGDSTNCLGVDVSDGGCIGDDGEAGDGVAIANCDSDSILVGDVGREGDESCVEGLESNSGCNGGTGGKEGGSNGKGEPQDRGESWRIVSSSTYLISSAS
jgi:hypothetical protein